MPARYFGTPFGSDAANHDSEYWNQLEQYLSGLNDPDSIFFSLTNELARKFTVHKGLLAIVNGPGMRLIAVSTWNSGRERKHLTLRLPSRQREPYTENFCKVFSGNRFERNLLFDENSESYLLQPLKRDYQVVGIMGFSSSCSTAFVSIDEPAFDRISNILAGKLPLPKTVSQQSG
jgi:hypothetical protein